MASWSPHSKPPISVSLPIRATPKCGTHISPLITKDIYLASIIWPIVPGTITGEVERGIAVYVCNVGRCLSSGPPCCQPKRLHAVCGRVPERDLTSENRLPNTAMIDQLDRDPRTIPLAYFTNAFLCKV
jgi:hypothetical protein